MRSQMVYCGACDQQVRVLVTDPPTADGQASLHDSEVVCLEIGEHCSGSLCPIGATAPDEMVRRLMHSGLPLDGLRMERRVCTSCGLDADMALHGGDRATCTACGTTTRWPVEQG